MKFSILIPCYNAEKTIIETLNSITSQNFIDYEIIVINDGSKDDSEFMVEKYRSEHNEVNIKLFSQENSGVSVARNNAILKSTGDYLIFIDADDLIHPNYLEKVSNILEKNKADSVYSKKTTDHTVFENTDFNNATEIQATSSQMLNDLTYNKSVFSWFSWVYSGNIIRQKHISFVPNTRYGEDWEFATKYLSFCQNGVCIDAAGYYYRILNTSVSRTITYSQVDAIIAAKRTAEYLSELNHPFAEEFTNYMVNKAVFSVAHRFAKAKDKGLFGKLRYEYDVNGAMKILSKIKSADKKTRIAATAYRIHPYVFFLISSIK